MRQPTGGLPGVDPEAILLIRVPVYGCDSGRGFWRKVDREARDAGFEVSRIFPAFYFHRHNREVTCVLTTHVDDFLWASKGVGGSIVNKLLEKFEVGRRESGRLRFCRKQFDKVDHDVVIDVTDNTNKIHYIEVKSNRRHSDPIDRGEERQLRSVVGSLSWISRQARPDILYRISKLQSSIKGATVATLHEANKVLEIALKGKTLKLRRWQLTTLANDSTTDCKGKDGCNIVSSPSLRAQASCISKLRDVARFWDSEIQKEGLVWTRLWQPPYKADSVPALLDCFDEVYVWVSALQNSAKRCDSIEHAAKLVKDILPSGDVDRCHTFVRAIKLVVQGLDESLHELHHLLQEPNQKTGLAFMSSQNLCNLLQGETTPASTKASFSLLDGINLLDLDAQSAKRAPEVAAGEAVKWSTKALRVSLQRIGGLIAAGSAFAARDWRVQARACEAVTASDDLDIPLTATGLAACKFPIATFRRRSLPARLFPGGCVPVDMEHASPLADLQAEVPSSEQADRLAKVVCALELDPVIARVVKKEEYGPAEAKLVVEEYRKYLILVGMGQCSAVESRSWVACSHPLTSSQSDTCSTTPRRPPLGQGRQEADSGDATSRMGTQKLCDVFGGFEPVIWAKQSAIWLSRARRAKKARKSFQSGQSCKEDVPMLSISEQDLKAEAAALRRAHRAVYGSQYPRAGLNAGHLSPSQSSPGQEGLVEAEGFDTTEDQSPVTSRGLRGYGSSDREEELRARLDVAEDLLQKTRPQVQEAAVLRRRLAASETRAAEMEATSRVVLRLCQELSAAMELQNVEFQRYVDAIRRQTGPFLEQATFIEADLGAVASSSTTQQGEGEAARLLEELQSERRQRTQKESELGEVRLQLARTVTDLQDAESRANELSAKLTHFEMEQNEDPGAFEDHQVQGDSPAKAEASIDQHRDPMSPYRRDQLIEEKRSRAQHRKQRRMEEAVLPQGRVAASAISSLSKGMVVSKLCAGTSQWERRLMQLSPAPPAGPQKLTWSKDGRRVFGRRLTSIDLKEVTNVGLGADSLPDKLRHKEASCGWRCFSLWTAKRSFFFKAESDVDAEHAVLALSRLCPATQPIPRRSVILHRAVGKLGPDPATRAATLLQALRQAGRGKEDFVEEQQEELSEGEESSSPRSDDIEEIVEPGLAEAETRLPKKSLHRRFHRMSAIAT
eukprot:s100_g1.t4